MATTTLNIVLCSAVQVDSDSKDRACKQLGRGICGRLLGYHMLAAMLFLQYVLAVYAGSSRVETGMRQL